MYSSQKTKAKYFFPSKNSFPPEQHQSLAKIWSNRANTQKTRSYQKL